MHFVPSKYEEITVSVKPLSSLPHLFNLNAKLFRRPPLMHVCDQANAFCCDRKSL